jgi:hypothetical protein
VIEQMMLLGSPQDTRPVSPAFLFIAHRPSSPTKTGYREQLIALPRNEQAPVTAACRESNEPMRTIRSVATHQQR